MGGQLATSTALGVGGGGRIMTVRCTYTVTYFVESNRGYGAFND